MLSPPPSPSPPCLTTTPASPPSLTSSRGGAGRADARTTTTLSHSRPRSRSPSPAPSLRRPSSSSLNHSLSSTAALAHASLGLVGSLPPSPQLASPRHFDSNYGKTAAPDEVEHLLPLSDPSPPLAPPRTSSEHRTRAPSVVEFVEPDIPQRDERKGERNDRGRRDRKRSFLGLGVATSAAREGAGAGEDEGSPVTGRAAGGAAGFARRLSFGPFSSSASSSSTPTSNAGPGEDPSVASNDPRRSPSLLSPASAHPAPLPAPIPPSSSSRKASGPKALLRRAKSFGTTSPVLQSPSTFAPPPQAQPPSHSPAPSPVLSLPRLSTSSLSLDPSSSAASHTASHPTASRSGSGFSTPLTPSSPYYSHPLHPHPPPHLFASYSSSSSSLPPPGPTTGSESTMVLPEPVPSTPHWLLMGTAHPAASGSSLNPLQSEAVKERERRRSADEQRGRDRSLEFAVEQEKKDASGKGKGKEVVGRKKTTRRATLGGFFSRSKGASGDAKAASAAERDASLEAMRSSGEGSVTGGGGPFSESPANSPALTAGTGTGRADSPVVGKGETMGGGASMPSLPSLPSLQLSSNPYRMSWAFGSGSPGKGGEGSSSSSPGKNGSSSPARRLSFIGLGGGGGSPSPSRSRESSLSGSQNRPSVSTRPSLSITTTPDNASPAPASPASTSPTKPSPLGSSSALPLSSSSRPPSPSRTSSSSTSSTRPPLRSSQTLTLPPPLVHAQSSDSASTLIPSSFSRTPGGLSRAHSASSPPQLRRSSSYASCAGPAPTGALPPSPGAAAYIPLTRSPLSSPTAERGNPLSASPHPHPAASSPSLARTLIRTRQARSHSDASDRRSPSSSSHPSPPLQTHTHTPTQYSPYRTMPFGGMSHPGGGGYFASAGLKVGEKPPPPSTRSSGEGGRRPSTGEAGGGGSGGRTSVFGSLGSFFSGGSSSSSSSAAVGLGGTSAGMSRSSSAATATSAGTPTGGVGEFGALFDGAAGGGGGRERASSVTRPGLGRKRGLSVGGTGIGIGSFFGGPSQSNQPPSSSSASASPSRFGGGAGRNRSGSASSAATTSSSTGQGAAGGLAPPSFDGGEGRAGGGVGGRMRALTDPNRRFSFVGSGGGGSNGAASLAPPGAGVRPGTADGTISPSLPSSSSPSKSTSGGRTRGGSLGAAGAPSPLQGRVVPKERKVPQPRVEEGETPEEWVRRLVEGEARGVRRVRREREAKEGREEREGKKEMVLEEGDEVEEVKSVEGAGEKDGEEEQEEEYEEVEEEGSKPLPKGEITRALASSSDPFHTLALQSYLRLFPFHHLPLDVALRVFLSAASLPSETQQIDRVMEAFARRWCECNPGVFGGENKDGKDGKDGKDEGKKEGEASDIPYVLAFSMVMLNTDHFNPNAKSKMTKADYVKNTRIDGVAPELLEYLYDQITLAPFIFVDSFSTSASSTSIDDFSPPSLFTPSPSVSSSSLLGGSIGPGGMANGNAQFSPGTSSGFFGGGREKGKVDPYHLIATGQTQRFRVDVESHIPAKSPFSFTGTTAFFNSTTLHSVFARAPILQITTRSRSSSKSSPGPQVTATIPPPLPGTSPSLSSTTGSPNPALDGSPLIPVVSNGTFIAEPLSSVRKKDRASTVSSLKITKIGLLSRKEDLAEGGKKAASRKWKGWSVVLTGSQLLFFKDPHFAASLQHALDAAAAASEPKPDDNHVLVFSIQTPFKPDAVLSLANSAAIYDSSYSKYKNVFRLVAPAGRQYLFQANDADNLNSWMHAINYAAAFKSAGVRIRPLVPALASGASSPRAASLRQQQQQQHEPMGGTNGLPQPKVQLEDRTTLGSQASAADVVSSKGSLVPNGEDDTIQPSSTNGHDNLPRSLQEALGANGVQPAVAERATSTASSSPRANEAAFAAAALPSVLARADLLRTKINELDAEIARARAVLQVDLRLAKHLAILTPFKSQTRERVLTAIPPIEKRVRHARMNLAKLVCYREVLSRDLLVEDRETERLVRKHSHHRTHSRRTSSIRARSPAPLLPASPRQSSFQHGANGSTSTFTSPLSQSTSSLRPPKASFGTGHHSDSEHTPRNSFDSAADSLTGAFDTANIGQPMSLTDDELDRLQFRSPPLMQRSRTEDWSMLGERHPPPLSGTIPNGAGLDLPLHHPSHHPHHHSPEHAFAALHSGAEEDELEVPPSLDSNGAAGTPIKKRSTDPAEAFVRGLVSPPNGGAFARREESREVLNAEAMLSPPPRPAALESRHSA
ncbi:hypothetical protein JCM8547_006785 [Rhodosporidiobolus lusitaniae]